jgi:hypothetical protein
MRAPIRFSGMVAVAFLACSHALAGSAQTAFVPWKVLERGATAEDKPFVLFWVPASPDEMRRSGLITSERLTLYSARCIGMNVVRNDDASMLEQLGATELQPVAILVERGKEVARVLSEAGALSTGAVESMVRQAFDTREAALNAMLDRASTRAAAGERDAAIDLYRQVAAHGCAFPRLAKTAQRALRRLGVKQ